MRDHADWRPVDLGAINGPNPKIVMALLRGDGAEAARLEADTMMRVGNPRKSVHDEDVARIRATKANLDAAQVAYRQAVLEAMNEKASYREVSRLTGIATSTLRAWKSASK